MQDAGNAGQKVTLTGIQYDGQSPAMSGPGTSVGYYGRCLDDYHSSTANGAIVDLYYCNGTNAQKWTLEPDGTVKNLAAGDTMCLDDTGWGGQGTPVKLYQCNGGANQQWSYSGGHWVNAFNGLCLNDPGYSTTPGMQQILWACGNYANESYSLP